MPVATRGCFFAILLVPPLTATALAQSTTEVTEPDIDVVAKRLDTARSQIQPSLGATTYSFTPDQLSNLPLGQDAPLNTVLLRAPGVATDSFGQIHVRDEHANVQYRLDGVQLPEGLSVFGQALETRFAHSLSLITGALPAQYGFNQAAVIDITTKSGTTDPGGEVDSLFGTNGLVQPGFSYGGRSGAVDYFVTGDFLHTGVGIESPTAAPTPLHDSSNQLHGFMHLSDIIDPTLRVSLIAGGFSSSFQLPNNPGQMPNDTVNGQSDFNSANLNQRQHEYTQFAIVSAQKHWDDVDLQVSAFTRASQLYYSPDPVGDLMFNGIGQSASRASWANGLQADASWHIDDRHTLRFGAIGQIERATFNTTSSVLPVDATGAQTAETPLLFNDSGGKTGTLYGVYVQHEWKLLPSLTLNTGARFDGVAEYTSETQLSPRVSLVWQSLDSTTLHVGYSRYFTPPPFELVGTSTALTQLLGTSGAPETTQNDRVRAERANYFDAGISHTVLPGLTVGLDGYFKTSDNLIDEGQFGAPIILTAFNYRHGQQQGIEFTTSYDNGPVSLFANLAWSRGIGKQINSAQFNFALSELAYIGQHWIYLDHDQRWTSSLGAAYTVGPGGTHPLKLEADLLVQSGLRASTDTVPNGEELPAYAVLNLSAVQKLDLGVWHGAELRVDVLNVLNTPYIIRNGTGVGVGAPQYGLRRTVLAGLTQRF